MQIASFLMRISVLTLIVPGIQADAPPYPIQFAIPESKVIKDIPRKDLDFAFIIPHRLETYIYDTESSYYEGYQRAYYGITMKKGGWDCLRHYEILANGCIPYFLDIDKCPENTMFWFPKKLIQEAMNLEGVSYLHIDHTKFDKVRYYEILQQLLDYTKEHLTTKNLAQYLLDTSKYNGTGKILFLSGATDPDYMRCLLLVGLKELMGDRIVDVPKIEHIYTSFPEMLQPSLYGKGMTYTRVIEDVPIHRENIEQRIREREFDFIIYGSVHRGTPYYDLVTQYYSFEKIAFICGEDDHTCKLSRFPLSFLRESSSFSIND